MWYQWLNAAGTDYDIGPYNIMFPAGKTLDTFFIQINNDDIVEGNENFSLSINQSSLPDNVTIGNHSQITVTIFDDDCKFCQ